MKSRWCSLRMVLFSVLGLLLVGCSPSPNLCACTCGAFCGTSLITPITPITPTLRYTFAVHALVESAGTVYALMDTPTSGVTSREEGSARLYALRASDGTLLWQQPADGMTGLLAQADTLYLSSNVSLQARRTSDGSLLWSVPEGGTSEGVGADPVLDQGILYTSSQDRLFAVRASDGHVLWQAAPQPTSTPGISSIEPYAPFVVNAGIVVVGWPNGLVTALQESSGTVLWQTTVAGATIASYPIAAAFGQVYVSAGQGVQILSSSDGHLEETLPGLSIGLFSPATVTGGVLYTTAGELPNTVTLNGVNTAGELAYAVQVPDNTVLWQTALQSALAAPTVVQGLVFFPGASTLLRTTDGSPVQPTQPLIALGPSGGYQAMGAVWYEGSHPFEDLPATISAFHEPDQELLWSTILPDG